MVLHKISRRLKHLYYHSCQHKRKCSLIEIYYRKIKYFIIKHIKLEIYHCPFCNCYHLGGIHKRTFKNRRYINKFYKVNLLFK